MENPAIRSYVDELRAPSPAQIEAALARGLDIDSFAPRLSFFLNAESDFLEEVAKFRASAASGTSRSSRTLSDDLR